MTLTFHEDTNRLEKCFQCLDILAHHQVDVGLPSSAGGGLAFILGIQEHGAPIMRIPPRPVVRPALKNEATREAMTEALGEGVSAAMRGDASGAEGCFAAAGQAGADGIRRYIDEGVPPPNSPVTVSGGWIYNRVAKKGVYVGGKGINKPLFDTGALYSAFGYEVKDR